MLVIFISILLCLAVQRYVNISFRDNFVWFSLYVKFLDRWLAKVNERLAMVLLIAPLWLVFLVLYLVLRKWHFYDIFTLFLATAVLFFSIDARDLKDKLRPYFSALQESNMQRAMDMVADFIDTSFIGNTTELERAVSKAILLHSFGNIFVGLFWFLFFGVYGVSAYTLVKLINQNITKINSSYVAMADFADKLQNIFEWLPARLVGFSFALAGRFSRGVRYCLDNFWDSMANVRKFVVESGMAALDIDPVDDYGVEESHAALDMIDRVIIIWLGAIFFILIGIVV